MIQKTRLATIIAVALLGGILTSIAYVVSPTEKILLSELVLCLSGREPSTSVLDLLSLSTQYLPLYVFCAIVGTSVYQHFCTASVYVFSRQSRRLSWYISELRHLAISVICFQLVFAGTVIFATSYRFEIEYNQSGLLLLGYHLLIQSFWSCALALIINIISIFWGSDLGLTLGIGFNMVLITLLSVPPLIEANPISRHILGWHSSKNEILDSILDNVEVSLDINTSVIYMFAFCAAMTVICGIILVKYDLLISNKETGGI